MKFLFDLFPVILFFIAYQFGDIFIATAVAIAAAFAQIGWLKLRGRKVDTMMWVTLGIIVVFGGATLLLHDDTFIKWKPTVLYWLFAVALAGAHLFAGKNLIRSIMEKQMQLPDPVWTRLNWSWAAFFTVLGGINLWVAFYVPVEWNLNATEARDIWVKFKVFGTMGLMLLFVVIQMLFLARYFKEEEQP